MKIFKTCNKQCSFSENSLAYWLILYELLYQISFCDMFFYLSNLIVSKCQRSHINSYFYLHQDHLNLYSDLLLQVYFRSCFCSVFNILSDKINIFFGLLLTASLYVGLIFCLNIGLSCCPVLLLAEGETVFCDLSWFHFYLDVNLY